MGCGLAILFAARGYRAWVWNPRRASIEQARERFSRTLSVLARSKQLPPDTDLESLQDAVRFESALPDTAPEFIFESVPENAELKAAVLAEWSRRFPLAIIATNTSSLSVNRLATHVHLPARFLGIHFMNPPAAIRFAEVVPGTDTAPEAVQASIALLAALGCEHIVCQDLPGFVVNRVLFALIGQSARLSAESGISPEQIDKALSLGANMPMGPFRLVRRIGLGTSVEILRNPHAATGEATFDAAPALQRLSALK